MKKTALALAILLAGCSSDDSTKKPEPQPQARTTDAPSKAQPAAAEKKPAATHEEPIAITIKKGDKRAPEAAFKGAPPPGQVCFDFKNVDLEQVALPLFSKQAGVTVEFHGTPRKLTLGFNQPIAWRDALGLICQFTNTHVLRSQIQGRLELKDGFADPAPFLVKYDPNDRTTPADAGTGVLGDPNRSGASGTPGAPASGGGGVDTSNQVDTSDSPHEGTGGAEMRKLLGKDGVTPNSSGGR